MSSDRLPVVVRLAQSTDARALSTFAARMFRETFGPYTPPEDLAVHLAATYTVEQQATEIIDPTGDVLVAEMSSPDGIPVLVGYAYVFRTGAPPCVRGPDPVELRRLYVDTLWHGRGVAQVLMAEVLRRAQGWGGRTLWLGVWEHNLRAQAFYRRYGFERVGEHIYPVGSDPQVDWLMSRSIVPGDSL